MYSLITKSAVLLSILTLLPLASASAELKRVPLILMDHGLFDFRNMSTVDLEGTGTSTHLGKIVSTGVFENVGNRRSGGFKGEIEGSSTSVLVPSPSPTVAGTAPGAATATPTNGKPNAITYRLSAEFFPGVPGVFYGIGTYRTTGGSDAFEGAKGFGEFIGLAICEKRTGIQLFS